MFNRQDLRINAIGFGVKALARTAPIHYIYKGRSTRCVSPNRFIRLMIRPCQKE